MKPELFLFDNYKKINEISFLYIFSVVLLLIIFGVSLYQLYIGIQFAKLKAQLLLTENFNNREIELMNIHNEDMYAVFDKQSPKRKKHKPTKKHNYTDMDIDIEMPDNKDLTFIPFDSETIPKYTRRNDNDFQTTAPTNKQSFDYTIDEIKKMNIREFAAKAKEKRAQRDAEIDAKHANNNSNNSNNAAARKNEYEFFVNYSDIYNAYPPEVTFIEGLDSNNV
jgi:hypothetical protein